MENKGGGLLPCINYQGLNQIIEKYLYLLPLVPSALEQLQGETIFINLNLCGEYNLVHFREGGE